jgi:hypothetical protein
MIECIKKDIQFSLNVPLKPFKSDTLFLLGKQNILFSSVMIDLKATFLIND